MKKIGKYIGKLFLQGLVAVLPIALTFYVLYWVATSAESLLGRLIRIVISDELYVSGMGVLVGFVIILGIGFFLKVLLVRKLFSLSDKLLERVPGIKSLYGLIRDLVGFFDSSKKKKFNKVVLVSLFDGMINLLGLVTQEDLSGLPECITKRGEKEMVAVFFSMSYNFGGYTALVPKDVITPVDMDVDDALQFNLTAGMASLSRTNEKT